MQNFSSVSPVVQELVGVCKIAQTQPGIGCIQTPPPLNMFEELKMDQ